MRQRRHVETGLRPEPIRQLLSALPQQHCTYITAGLARDKDAMLRLACVLSLLAQLLSVLPQQHCT